ncbi:hypothetical protein DFH06DRAFT_1318426 [Mycena polygramma]|nr:hypothetical protein DFH06DRAFT_1318426 [Mycena polygramma]
MDQLGIPSFRADIVKWNTAYENLFPVIRSFARDLDVLTSVVPSDNEYSEAKLELTRDKMRHLSTIQEELRGVAVTVVLQPDFCWKRLSHSARQDHMHEGLYRTCMKDPDTPDSRLYTCDITLESLQRDDGEGFLALLRKYVPDNGARASAADGGYTPYLHPEWDPEHVKRLRAGGRPSVDIVVMARDDFLISFLFNTMLSVFGTPRAPEILLKGYDGVPVTISDTRASHKKPVRSKTDKQMPSAPLYRMRKFCETCDECEKENEAFSVCKKCNDKMSRKVFYCSRTCQVSDWPNHKKICGKELTPDLIGPKADTTALYLDALFLLRKIGPAVNGYEPSPALLR